MTNGDLTGSSWLSHLYSLRFRFFVHLKWIIYLLYLIPRDFVKLSENVSIYLLRPHIRTEVQRWRTGPDVRRGQCSEVGKHVHNNLDPCWLLCRVTEFTALGGPFNLLYIVPKLHCPNVNSYDPHNKMMKVLLFPYLQFLIIWKILSYILPYVLLLLFIYFMNLSFNYCPLCLMLPKIRRSNF